MAKLNQQLKNRLRLVQVFAVVLYSSVFAGTAYIVYLISK